MANSGRITRHTSILNPAKVARPSRYRQPCFTLKRSLLFQVRKSLVEYVDEELLRMNTSVFYQRVFILARNLDPNRESQVAAKLAALKLANNETAQGPNMQTEEGLEEDQHYSQPSTNDDPIAEKAAEEVEVQGPKALEIVDPNKETIQNLFRFDEDEDETVQSEAVAEEAEPQAEVEVPELPKDAFQLFSEMLQDLQKKCRHLAYTPDPMCGLFLYMNDYTMLMLEGAEDVMGIFCGELLQRVGEYWQSNRVFMIEDNLKQLYTKELISRRIPAAWINEKFPTSTPTDEYLMGKQHLIIKDKLHTICRLIRDLMEPKRETIQSDGQSLAAELSEVELADESDEEVGGSTHASRMSSRVRTASVISTHLPTDIFRKLLPEIQRIELVLASTRFYYTLDEFYGIYGTVPFRPDEDGQFWPVLNNYTPPNIFRRTPFDINLTFADYAADMNRRMLEEQEAHKAELEAAAEAEAHAAAEAQSQASKKPTAKEQETDAD